MYSRIVELPIKKKSLFLFGPRQVGKSTLIHSILSEEEHINFDLLEPETFLKFKTDPGMLSNEVRYHLSEKKQLIIFIDEIQKAPELLDEIHHLIEKYKKRVFFVLTGSSARKLKKATVNMLGGRAWEFHLFPLTYIELGKRFKLDEVLLKGSLPPVVDEDLTDSFRTLHAYTQTYLKQEILDEAMVRNIGAFGNFLRLAADQSGKLVNYSTISREVGVSSKTIKGYYEILEDTLITLKLEPYLKSFRKRVIQHPKHYLFDTGIINSLSGRVSKETLLSPTTYGLLFEHFVILETYRLLSYTGKPFRIYYWRSSHGAEVDLIIEYSNTLWAIEIKSSKKIKSAMLTGLRSFAEVYPDAKMLCVSKGKSPYMAGDVPVIPWNLLFEKEYLNISAQFSAGV